MSKAWQITNCGEPVEFDAHIAAGIRAVELRYEKLPFLFYLDKNEQARHELHKLKQTIIEIP